MSALPFKGQSPMNPSPWGVGMPQQRGGGMMGRLGGMMGFPGMGGGRGFPPMGMPQRGPLPSRGGWGPQGSPWPQGPIPFNPRAGGGGQNPYQVTPIFGPGSPAHKRILEQGGQDPYANRQQQGPPMGGGWNQMMGRLPPFMQQKMSQMGPQFGQQPQGDDQQHQVQNPEAKMGQPFDPFGMQRQRNTGIAGGMMGPSQGGFGQMLQNMQMRKMQPMQQQEEY